MGSGRAISGNHVDDVVNHEINVRKELAVSTHRKSSTTNAKKSIDALDICVFAWFLCKSTRRDRPIKKSSDATINQNSIFGLHSVSLTIHHFLG